MKTAVFLPLLLLVACTAHAFPLEPDTPALALEVMHHPDLTEPHVQEAAVAESQEALVRERRSPQNWQPQSRRQNQFQPRFQPGPQQQPQPQPQQPSRGGVSGSVHRERGVGTVVRAEGQGNVWTSRSGNSRVDAHGDYTRVVRGPQRGRPSYNVGATFSHRW